MGRKPYQSRLQQVIELLYRPPDDGVRRVFALSRSEAERLPALPSIAIISVTAPERPPANLNGFDHVLRLTFDDVDFLNPSSSRSAQKKARQPFTPAQAQLLRAFINELPEIVETIVVHCEGGYSRSCAIALALHRMYGYTVEMDRLGKANASVVQILTNEIKINPPKP
jgi:predicted protein tyrosine phosphatase